MKIIGLFIVVVSVLGLGVFSTMLRKRRRVRAADVPDAHLLRAARKLPARVFIERSVLGGPQAGRTNRGQADLVLTNGRLLVATHQGRVLELTPERPGSVRCTGPRRLVIEGGRLLKEGELKVRVELICDEAEAWAQLAAEHLGAKNVVERLGG